MNRALVAVGVGCVAVGLARTVGVLDVALPAGTYGFVAVASAAAVVAGVALYRDGRGDVATATAEPPTRSRPERPGAAAADAIAALRVFGRRSDGDDGRYALQERLRALAVDVLVAKRNVTPTVAREMLDDGTWTDDAAAAAFFQAGAVPALSTRDQVAAARSGDPPFARRARRVLAELDRLERDR